MSRYIDADALIDFLDIGHLRHPDELSFSEVDVANLLLHAPTADIIDRKTHEAVCKQIMWERDVAIGQLKEIGKSFGEKMDDVAPVVHGRWVMKETMIRSPYAKNTYCSKCFYETGNTSNYCPNCGCRMDEKEGEPR